MSEHCPPSGTDWSQFMRLALDQARAAAQYGEVPIGAVLVSQSGEVLALARNAPIGTSDPKAHAEILCLRQAGAKVGNYRLPGTVLVATIEPCLMCVGALIQARVAGVVFGARDEKAGAVVSNLPGAALPFTNHRFWVLEGVLAEECGELLSDFFRERRKA